jgi:ketosteroid isomerase-like protein
MALSEQDMQAIKATYEQMMQRMTQLDWQGFVGMCTDDMIHVTADGHLYQSQNKASLYQRLTELMGEVESFDMEYSIHTINGDGNCAYVLTPNKDILKFSGSQENLVLDNCQTLSILEKQPDNSWKLKLQMCIVPPSPNEAH